MERGGQAGDRGRVGVITALQLARLRPRAARKIPRAERLRRAPREPRAIALQYVRSLRTYTGDLHAIVKREIFPFLDDIATVKKDGYRADVLTGELYRRIQFVRDEFVRVSSPHTIAEMITPAGRALSAWTSKEVQRVVGISPRSIPEVSGLIDEWRKQNVELIHSLPVAELDRVQRVLDESAEQGRTVDQIAARLEEQFDIVDNKASFIARDQVLKLNGQMQQERQQAAGVTSYLWTTAGDERVRPTHQKLDGAQEDWNSPPIVSEDGRREHPGGDFLCRCFAVPVTADEE
jgi:SPP1 gp7 family putative phage head morphogenesis protein